MTASDFFRLMNQRLSHADERRRQLARQVRSGSVEGLLAEMVEQDVRRAFVLFENGTFTLSHPSLLAPIQAYLELCEDFHHHEGVFIGREEGLHTLFFAFVHDTRRGLAQGGLRFRRYDDLASLLFDGLRLAQGMTRKNALAGLWWGGGKGIIQLPPGYRRPEELALSDPLRLRIFEAYGRFIASLGGIYYTAEDVGTTTADMNAILSQNRFITCIGRELGGSGNPSPHTARGVLLAIRAAWRFLCGTDDLQSLRVAVQGAGNVGAPLIHLLSEAGASVWVSDVNQIAIGRLQEELPALQVVGTEDIYDLDVDVFAPCALGAVVNRETIPRLKVKLVCGAANNILRDDEQDAQLLEQRGIAFVPDFLCNRMGITNCADEWMGYLEEDVRLAVERVYPDTFRVLRYARQMGVTPLHAANELADIAASELHPLFGHRGRRLADHLLVSGWHEGGDDHQDRRPRVEPLFRPGVDEPKIRAGRHYQEQARGDGAALACAPVSAAARPNLAALCSPLLMDVRARTLIAAGKPRPRRVVGSEHGGLALQLAVERSLSVERSELERTDFVEHCRDACSANDAAIRDQLHRLGVGFDPGTWLDPIEESVAPVVDRLFHALYDAGIVGWERHLEYRCPRCQSVLTDSDVDREALPSRERYVIEFPVAGGGSVRAVTYALEQVLSAVAILVHEDGPRAVLVGSTATHPLTGAALPILAGHGVRGEAAFVAPSFSREDLRLARRHNLESPPIFDGEGRVLVPGEPEPLTVDAAREAIRAALGRAVTVEEVDTEVLMPHCTRCHARVHPDVSRQIFVHLEAAADHLRQAIDRGAVRFSHPAWATETLERLYALQPWCISRQYWWGNEIPAHRGIDTVPGAEHWVFSTWFSQVAWTLAGMGWPSAASPEPIAEVFVDHERLRRWVIPSQLVALALFRRPAFAYVHVHGTVQVPERLLVARDGAGAELEDEERGLYRVRHAPMRKGLGNVVEPAVLMQRFGADALRLGYLLAGAGAGHDGFMLDESRLRQGRALVRTFVGKLTGVERLLRRSADGEPRLADVAFLREVRRTAAEATVTLEECRFGAAAEVFARAVTQLSRYADLLAARSRDGGADGGAPRAAMMAALAELQRAFQPLCPYLFEKIGPQWFAAGAVAFDADPRVCLVDDLMTQPAGAAGLPVVTIAARHWDDEVAELSRLLRTVVPRAADAAGDQERPAAAV